MLKTTIATAALLFGGVLLAPAPAFAGTTDCEAYTYKANSLSLCSEFPDETEVDCPQIGQPVRVTVVGTDPWQLDADDDGFGCETETGGSGGVDGIVPTAAPAADAGTDGTDTEAVPQLPDTGLSGTWLAGGAVLLAAGAGTALIARRRRYRFEA